MHDTVSGINNDSNTCTLIMMLFAFYKYNNSILLSLQDINCPTLVYNKERTFFTIFLKIECYIIIRKKRQLTNINKIKRK